MPTTPPATTLELIGNIVGWIIGASIIGAWLWWWFKKSDDRSLLVVKWLLCIPGFVGFYYDIRFLREKVDNGGNALDAILGGGAAAALGLYFAIIWRKNLAMLVARPFGALYDGGSEEAPPEAHYSSAIAKRKFGHYPEAIADIRKQLEKFPTDFTGHMMLAEIQAENQNDLPTAMISIQRILNQPKHAPRNIAYALNTLADWQLKYALDPEAAREALQQIVERLPESEFTLLAQQRIAHLATREHLAASHDRPRIALTPGVQNIGLLESSAHLAPAAADQTHRAEQLLQHLQLHPHDTEAREQLAIVYADYYQRLDYAADQLSQLINQPNQPARQVIHWLNLLADLQIRHHCNFDSVSETLLQIIARYPNHAAAQLARNRIDLLRLELKSKDATRAVKLGTYEQNIGLKQDFGGRQRD